MGHKGSDLPRRVVLISHDDQIGGAQLALRDTALALTTAGVHVHAVVPRTPRKGPLGPRLAAVGAEVHSVPVGLWGRAPYGPRLNAPHVLARATAAAARLTLLLRKTRPDLVISNTGLPAAGAVAAHTLGLPHAWWLHERQRRDAALEFALPLAMMRRVMVRTGHVLVPSNFLASECAEWVPPEKLHIIAPWVDVPPVSRQVGHSVPTHRVLFPGGLQTVKRPLEAVQAVLHLRKSNPAFTLDIVGYDGPERNAVESALRSAAAQDAVRVRGVMTSLVEEFVPGTVLVSAGASETFGRVLVEAMASGVPVVAASAGATPEVIAHDRTGLLYPPGDFLALATCLQALADDEVLRQRLVQSASLEWAARWTVEAHLASLSAAWEKLRPHAL